MASYANILKATASVIKKKGMLVIHKAVSQSGSYTPETDSYTTTETATSVWAVRTSAGYNEQRNYGFSIGSSVLYVAGDVLNQINVSDYFEIDGIRWNVVAVNETAPASEKILYAIELKEAGSVSIDPQPEEENQNGNETETQE